MAVFRFRAADAAGRVVEGEREGGSSTEVARRLRDEALTPLAVREAEPSRHHGGAGWLGRIGARRSRRMGPGELVLFTRQLATLLGADLPIDQALATIAAGDEGGCGRAAREVRDGLRRGAALSDAMAEARADDGHAIFPAGYVALVRAGEASGALPKVLEELAQGLARARALERELRAALTYPTVVLVVTIAAVGLLLGAVIPEFAPLFEDAGDALPASAGLVLAASELVRAHWREGLIAALAAWLVLARLARLQPVRRRVDAILAGLPVAGPLIRMADGARFSRALATLLANGVEVAPALEMSVATLRNRRLAERLEAAIPRVRRGEGVAGPLESADALPAIANQLIRAGESASRLPAMLDTVAEILEADVRRRMQQLVGLVTPALTIVLGAIVALVIGAVMGAIMSAYDLPF